MSAHPRYHNNDTASAALTSFGQLPPEVHTLLGMGGRKIMRRLCREAPGTYFHSARIWQLMEEADCISSEREVAAVLTHDIGKLLSPSSFAENEATDKGCPAPWMLAGHVDFGVKLAQDAELDDLAFSAILQHHGTQEITQDLRYQGYIPDSPFTCALMMADTIEAIHSAGPLETDYIWAVHATRMRQGQFDHLDSWTCETVTRQLIGAAQHLGWQLSQGEPQSDVA